MDFCEVYWNDKYANSQPSCDDFVLPTITFYDKDDNERIPLCKINLNQANDGDLSEYCPNLITSLNGDNEGILKEVLFS